MDTAALAALPKVLLHDHLDGGVRPATLVELAAEVGYAGLGASSAEEVAAAIHQGRSGSLETYLQAFAHTLAVMQRPEAIERVAREAVEDLAADGVVYAEIRFAPSLHTREGLTRDEVVRAALQGFHSGSAATGVPVFAILDAMRQDDDSEAVAEVAFRFRDDGVVGFDLAGPERGFPPSRHGAACRFVAERHMGLTIHAGEGDGPASIADALACGARRLGHGVRIVEDCVVSDGRIVARGSVASEVHERRVPLEVCPWSNVHTMGIAPAQHPARMLARAGFVVTLNTDNRLMSGTSMTDEFRLAVDALGFGLDDLYRATVAASDAAFCSEGMRASVRSRIDAGYDGA